MNDLDEVPALVAQLNDIVRQLEALFPGRKFTLDGHLVGSLGEVVAASVFDLELLPASAEGHDARARDGRLVQVKLAQSTQVGIRSSPAHLLVTSMDAALRNAAAGSRLEVMPADAHGMMPLALTPSCVGGGT